MEFLSNMRIRTKLFLSFTVMSLLLIFMGARTYSVLSELDNAKTDLSKSYELADNMSESKYAIRSSMQAIMEMLACENTGELEEWWKFHLEQVDGFDEPVDLLTKNASDELWGEEFTELKHEVYTQGMDLDKIHNNSFQPAVQSLYEAKKQLLNSMNTLTPEEVTLLEEKLHEYDKRADGFGDEVVNAMEDTEENVLKIVTDSMANSEELESSAKLTVLTIASISILLAIVLGFMITSSITGPLKSAIKFTEKFSEGDLLAEIDVDQKDEVGDMVTALKNMRNKLKDIISFVVTSADNIASASEQMSETSQQMSQGTQEQAASAEEISASMEEMTSNIQQNTDNAQHTEKIAIKAAEEMKESSVAVNSTVDSMKKIAGKIGIIGEIARQTNLLALNAAVEAARAGEHGKGFAVVAAEVRKLAERSQVAAEEINELSESSVSVADKSGRLLEQIVPNIQNTSKLVQEIAASSLEQNNGADQVNNAIQQFNQVIQQNAAGAEEIASSAEELAAQAESLKETISFFKLGQNTNKVVTKSVKSTPQVKHTFTAKPMTSVKPVTSKKGAVIDLDKKDNLDSDYQKF